MRLDIGIGATEELVHALDRQILDDIDIRAAAVVAAVRIAFGIFVGEHRALRFEHGLAHEILRSNQFDGFALADFLAGDRGGDGVIGDGQTGSAHACIFDLLNCVRRNRFSHAQSPFKVPAKTFATTRVPHGGCQSAPITGMDCCSRPLLNGEADQ